MRRLICFFLVLAMMVYFAGCGEGNDLVEENSSVLTVSTESELTDQEKYDAAIKLLEENNYTHAIKYLEEIPNYNDAKALAGKAHYVYGSELFNEKDFPGAYTHFLKASGYADVSQRKAMVDYYGGIYLVNQEKYADAYDYFKRAIDSEYIQESIKHITTLTNHMLSGGWIGSCFMNGATLQVEMSYSKSNNRFSLVWADRRDGSYRYITDMDYGTLSILGSRNAFYYEGNFYTVEFDFISSTSVRVKWSNSELNDIAGGVFSRNHAAIFDYKISSVTYPTMTIPELFGDSQTEEIETSGSAANGQQSTNSTTIANSKNTDTTAVTKAKSTKRHTHNYTIAATCEGAAKCECGATRGTPLYHDWKNANCENPKTCLTCGKTSGSPLGHDWKTATCDAPKICVVCRKTSGSALGHSWKEATCDAPKTCFVCNETSGSPLGHEYDSNNVLVCDGCDSFRPDAETILKTAAIEMVDGEYVSLNSAEILCFDYYGGSSYTVELFVHADVYDPTIPTIHAKAYDQSGNLIGSGSTPTRPYTQVWYYVSIDVPTNCIPSKFVVQG